MEQALKLVDATEKAVAIVEAKAPPATLPELPADLRRCLEASKQGTGKSKQASKGKAEQKKAGKLAPEKAAEVSKVDAQAKPSADALVLARLEAARKRDACARSLLKWYEQQTKGPAKVAAVSK